MNRYNEIVFFSYFYLIENFREWIFLLIIIIFLEVYNIILCS